MEKITNTFFGGNSIIFTLENELYKIQVKKLQKGKRGYKTTKSANNNFNKKEETGEKKT